MAIELNGNFSEKKSSLGEMLFWKRDGCGIRSELVRGLIIEMDSIYNLNSFNSLTDLIAIDSFSNLVALP
jgi:hypothetical protein